MSFTLNASIFIGCFFLFLTGCTTIATNETVADSKVKPVKDIGLSNIWVSSLFKSVSIDNSNMKLYVKHRKNGSLRTNVADYFLIVHEVKEGVEKGFITASNKNIVKKELAPEMIGLYEFSVSLYVFDAVSSEKGEYYNLIENTPYSAPNCGVLTEYKSESGALKITVVDAVSCGQLGLETTGGEYSNDFKRRVGDLLSLSGHAFSYVIK
jgi:hypothetical protein